MVFFSSWQFFFYRFQFNLKYAYISYQHILSSIYVSLNLFLCSDFLKALYQTRFIALSFTKHSVQINNYSQRLQCDISNICLIQQMKPIFNLFYNNCYLQKKMCKDNIQTFNLNSICLSDFIKITIDEVTLNNKSLGCVSVLSVYIAKRKRKTALDRLQNCSMLHYSRLIPNQLMRLLSFWFTH